MRRDCVRMASRSRASPSSSARVTNSLTQQYCGLAGRTFFASLNLSRMSAAARQYCRALWLSWCSSRNVDPEEDLKHLSYVFVIVTFQR